MSGRVGWVEIKNCIYVVSKQPTTSGLVLPQCRFTEDERKRPVHESRISRGKKTTTKTEHERNVKRLTGANESVGRRGRDGGFQSEVRVLIMSKIEQKSGAYRFRTRSEYISAFAWNDRIRRKESRAKIFSRFRPTDFHCGIRLDRKIDEKRRKQTRQSQRHRHCYRSSRSLVDGHNATKSKTNNSQTGDFISQRITNTRTDLETLID